MQKTAVMNIETRTSTSKGANNLLRKNGYLPANIFGKGVESISIAIKRDEFIKSLKKYGRNAVFKLVTPSDEAYTVMTKEIQIAPIINEVSHLDFQLVSLLEEIKMDVSIRIIGSEFLEAKRLLLNSNFDSILVSGLPHDIPHEIEIDVSTMKSGESILFKDLKLPDGITSDIDPEQRILTVSGSRVKEEGTETE
jgi:large subunit ribosomal protein L25